MLRFVHTSDWHLGRPFARFADGQGGDLPARLREARLQAVRRIAEVARGDGAAFVLAAGDLWDSETPRPDQVAQALGIMASASDLTWALLPGNHDPARPGGLWERIAADPPANLRLLTTPEPVELAPGHWLLPAPVTTKDPGRDLTAWMDAAATPEGARRIGIGHGPALSFAGAAAHDVAIAPDRAARAGLAYLALGDAHSPRSICPRQRYSGTPEPDRFGLRNAGVCLSVCLDGAAAPPEVRARPVARFAWCETVRRLSPGEGAAAAGPGIAAMLPQGHDRRDTLLRTRLEGSARASERAAWANAAAGLAPELAYLELDTEALETLYAADDLDRIDRGGAMRAAADALKAEAEDPMADPHARAAAAAALDLLFTWSLEPEASGAEGPAEEPVR